MTSRRFHLLSALFLCLATCFSSLAYASHLRGTTVSWAPTGTPGTVQFTIQYSQREDFNCTLGTNCPVVGGTVPIPFNFGEGAANVIVNATVTSINNAQDYLSAVATFSHTYSGAGPYIAFYEAGARITTIKSGNNSKDLRMETLVLPAATPVKPSPVVSMPAIVTVPLQPSTEFTVFAVSPDGDTLTYRLATSTEMYGPTVTSFSCAAQEPPGMTINNSGVVTWDTTQITTAGCNFTAPASGDIWAAQFEVEGRDSSNVVISKTPLDIIVQLNVSSEISPAITFSNPGPITINPGTPFTFSVGTSDPSPNARVTFNVSGLPVGASSSIQNQTVSPPATSTFTWTPTKLQGGTYLITYSVTNDTFQQTLQPVTIIVPTLYPPLTSCPASLTAEYNTAFSVPVQVSDPQGDALTVDWSADGTVVHTDNIPPSAGTTLLSLSQTFASLGSHTVSINATNTDSFSSTCSTPVTVTMANQVITFSALPGLTYGSPDVVLTATSSSGLPVTFSASGSCSNVNGLLHATSSGSCSVTASQAGSANYNAATPVDQAFQIAQAPLTVTAQSATRLYGVANPAFTGTITGVANSDSIAATYSSSATITSAPGTYTIVPAPAGTALSNYAVTATNGTLTVTKAAGMLAVPTVSPANSPYGTSVVITQAVPAGETGTVTFYSGATVLGMATISNGVAILTTSLLPAGTLSLSGQSSGDTNFSPATSPAVPDTVSKGNGTLPPPLVSPANAPYGTSVTLTEMFPPGETGTITFYNGSTALGTATISNGVATLTTKALPPGVASLTAQSSGDMNNSAATSPATSDTVAKITSSLAPLTVTPLNAIYGTSVTLTQPVPADETGTVSFYNGTILIGTATISNGVATLTTTALPAGSDPLLAQTSGDANYVAAKGAPVVDIVGAAPITLTLTVSGASANPTLPVTFTATLTSPSGIPTGTVQFFNGSTLLGTGTLTGGVATFTTTLPAGSVTIITASYLGTASASTGAGGVTVVTGPLDFGYTLAASSTASQTVARGAAATYNLTVVPLYGTFPGVVSFTVTGLPAGATYTLSPATLPANSTGAAQVLTVQTSPVLASASELNLNSKLAPILLGLLMLPVAGSRRMRKSSRGIARYGLFSGVLILSTGALFGLLGCGTSNGVYHQDPQSYTVTVTATSASISRAVTVTLNEQ